MRQRLNALLEAHGEREVPRQARLAIQDDRS
jgi:hypothetical protein